LFAEVSIHTLLYFGLTEKKKTVFGRNIMQLHYVVRGYIVSKIIIDLL